MSAQRDGVLAVMDEYAAFVGDDHAVNICNCDIREARAAVAEQQRVLRRLVAWNSNVNGTGEELGEICQEAEACVARMDPQPGENT